jgi:hypothetical protein
MPLYSLVVVDDFNVLGAIGSPWPLETKTPLRVDADAVLALPVARQSLQPVAAELCKLPQALRRFKNPQALLRLTAETFEGGNSFAFRKVLAPPIPVAPNHRII